MHHFEGVCFSSWLFLISQLLEAGVRNSWNRPETGLGWDLNVINLNVHSFLRGRKFFILYRMVGRTWREVLTPGYLEPCSFPSEWVAMSSSRGSSQTKESNSHVLHLLCWQVGYWPLSHLGSPVENLHWQHISGPCRCCWSRKPTF